MSAKITFFFKIYGFDVAFFQATKRTSVQPQTHIGAHTKKADFTAGPFALIQ